MNASNDLPDFARCCVNLATPRLGAEAVSASDEFFAPRARLIDDAAAVFIPDKYDDHGKWMDGWESRRKRSPGHDHCIVRLGVKGRIRGVDIDTSHFTGNYPPAASIEACLAGKRPLSQATWREIVPATTLGPSAHHFVAVGDDGVFDHVRLNIYPDGGVARLRVYGEPVAAWADDGGDGVYELSALANGGRIVGCNDAHYGSVWTLITPGRGRDMGDGWETRRRREPGNDWLVLALGAPGLIERIEIDTCHFKGNFPDRAAVAGALVAGGGDRSLITRAMLWPEVLGPRKLQADHLHTFAVRHPQPVSHVRLDIFPDGGVSRLRVFGRLCKAPETLSV
jgi:allantoicase